MKAILLIGFGGPQSMAEVTPFLESVLKGVRIPPERYQEVFHHYELIGGHSFYNEVTQRQKKALESLLAAQGQKVPVYIGYRHSTPSFADAWRAMLSDGVTDVFGFILSPLHTYASFEKYTEQTEEARTASGAAGIPIRYSGPFYDDARFVSAQADELKKTLTAVPEPGAAFVLFSAHSVPTAMSERSGYARQFFDSAFAVARKAGVEHWLTGYQSRSGSPRDPWLEPDVISVIGQIDRSRFSSVVLAPVGFLCDNVEVVYDLDIEARAAAEKAGLRYFRAPTVADHPDFIRLIAELALR